MKVRYLIVTALAALLLGGCATYGYKDGYRGGSGDYYYGRSSSSGYYGAPYGSVGYGRYGGVYGSVGYGYPGYSRYSYWPRSYYGSRYPYYGSYYPPYYHGRPIVRPRPDNSRPDNRPNAPWRNLQGVTRVEHRARPERIERNPAGLRTQGQRERIQPAVPSNRRGTQRSSNSPWRAGPARSSERSRAAPAPARQSAPVQRTRAAPSRPAPRSRARDSDRGRSIEP